MIKEAKYRIPKGLSTIKTLLKTKAFLKDSIGVLEEGFELYGDTFSLRSGKQLSCAYILPLGLRIE